MTLDEMLDRQEPERPPERRGWLALRILLMMLVATAIGGALLVGLLYVLGLGLFAAWAEWFDGFGT